MFFCFVYMFNMNGHTKNIGKYVLRILMDIQTYEYIPY